MSLEPAGSERTFSTKYIDCFVFYRKIHHTYTVCILRFTVEHRRKPRYTSNDLTRLVFGAVFSEFGFSLLAVLYVLCTSVHVRVCACRRRRRRCHRWLWMRRRCRHRYRVPPPSFSTQSKMKYFCAHLLVCVLEYTVCCCCCFCCCTCESFSSADSYLLFDSALFLFRCVCVCVRACMCMCVNCSLIRLQSECGLIHSSRALRFSYFDEEKYTRTKERKNTPIHETNVRVRMLSHFG